jgi:phospholipase/lecithinase/hemolysin
MGLALSASLIALGTPAPAAAQTAHAQATATEAAPQSWLAFGDSLTDTGNAFALTGGAIPDPAFYRNGRFANGPVWFDQIAPTHGLLASHLTGTPPISQHNWNFAVAGANSGTEQLDPATGTPPGLRTQIGLAQALISRNAIRVDRSTTAVLWAGANDHGMWLTSPDRVASQDMAIAAASAANVDAATLAIGASGIGRVAVLNLFDFSLAPTTALLPGSVRVAGDAITRRHNGLLLTNAERANAALGAQHGTSVLVVDVHGLFAEIARAPKAWGFDSLAPCLPDGGAPTCTSPGSAERRLFWDGTHLTSAGHRLVAEAVRGTLLAGEIAPGLATQTTGIILSATSNDAARARRMVQDGQAGLWFEAQSFALPTADDPQDRNGRFARYAAGWTGEAGKVLWGGSLAWTAGDLERERTRVDTSFLSASLFVRRDMGTWALMAQAGAGSAELGLTRQTGFAPAAIARGDTDAATRLVELSADTRLDHGAFSLVLDGGLAWASASRESWRERDGSVMNLTFARQKIETLTTRLDARASWQHQLGAFTVGPYADLNWRDAIESTTKGGQVTMGSGQRLAPADIDQMGDRLDAELGLRANWFDILQASVGWQRSIKDDNDRGTSLNMALSVRF